MFRKVIIQLLLVDGLLIVSRGEWDPGKSYEPFLEGEPDLWKSSVWTCVNLPSH